MLRASKKRLKHTLSFIAQQLLAALNAQINTIAASHQADHVTEHLCRVVGVELPLVFRVVRAVA